MTATTHAVLQKLKFWAASGKRKTGKELAALCQTSERQVQDAIKELRTQNFNGVRYFIDAKMVDGDYGYLLIDDIEAARTFLRAYHSRAVTYHETEAGMKLALQYMMDRQGITGTLFEVPE